MTLSTDIETLPQVAEKGEAERPLKARPLPVAVISAITIGVIIAAWGLASAYALVSPVFLPSPRQVVLALYNLVVTGFVDATLAEHVGASLYRIFGALIASILIGIPAGIAIGTSRLGRGILDPIVEFLRPLPPLAYLPLIIIWVGIGEASKITVIALSMLPSIILSTSAGVRGVSKDHVNAARSLGASRRQVLREVVLPSAVPSILTGVRIALGAGWTTLVAAELVAATSGIGFMIQSAAQFLVTDIVIAGIVVIALIAILLEYVARQIERRLVPWAAHR
ncbi:MULTISPECIES: ABC transporter permease subunit [unclassified Shinella]|uniref:ABC transporter permease subunit n=1 Tax=unclassified Shinella TaxID=2643062 RepID=UPI00225CF4C9|nr:MULTISPECIES: ABC transporter permease subunit [unclassified Shinella]MCO5138208.1 ABC transporter permease subunit [Shinella sp.]MDC7258325.1 ABC transporter permease subunit [Shinella sp. YE25]CAI0335661.1 taurine ABC transporter membrane subunit [Rhizobiaceae bacterium]CAK7259964.1 taurine ABC transporter membrane subunit [Shinella sp. WSC3-e]